MTPLEIEILLHYYDTPGDYLDGDFSGGVYRSDDFSDHVPGSTGQAVSEAIDRLVKAGMLKQSVHVDQLWEATPAVKVYIEALCEVPLPIKMWVMPEKDMK